MKFWFCEHCGKRLTDKDLEEGLARDKKLNGVCCRTCATFIITVESVEIAQEGHIQGKPAQHAVNPVPEQPVKQISAKKIIPVTSTSAGAKPQSISGRAQPRSVEKPGSLTHNFTMLLMGGLFAALLLLGLCFLPRSNSESCGTATTTNPSKTVVATQASSTQPKIPEGNKTGIPVVAAHAVVANNSEPVRENITASVTGNSTESTTPLPPPAVQPEPAVPPVLPAVPAGNEPVIVQASYSERADMALNALLAKAQMLGDEKNEERIKLAENYLKEYGKAFVASRARVKLEEWKAAQARRNAGTNESAIQPETKSAATSNGAISSNVIRPPNANVNPPNTKFTMLASKTTSTAISSTDMNAPLVMLTAPAKGAVLSGTNVTISATASDDIAMSKVEFIMDGNQLIGTVNASAAIPNAGEASNPGFENGASPWKVYGNFAVVDSNARSGKYACRIAGANGGALQQVNGLKPNTTYTFKGWAKVTAGDQVFIGVKNYGGDDISKIVSTANYSQATVNFTTGPNHTSAVIYILKSAGAGTAWGDDFSLTGGSTYAITWNATTVPNGQHSLIAKAYDTSENVGASAGTAITVKNAN
jgi:hypothetical protein